MCIRDRVSEAGLHEPLKKVMRRATPADLERRRENTRKKEEAYRTCRRLIQKHGLTMKLVDVDYVFDGSSAVFYFTSEGRVDFRELVKELASALKARIEMRQVGVRDEAKMVGGLGPCGLSLIHISEPTRLGMISYAVFCLKKKKQPHKKTS